MSKLWDSFLDYVDKKRIAETEERRQARGAAVDEQKKAKDEAEFDKAQSTIVDNLP